MIKKQSGRQEVISGEISFGFADIDGTTFHGALELPAGARVIGGQLITLSPAQSSVVADIGDATVTNRYTDNANVAAAGEVNLTPTGFQTTVEGDVGVTFSAKPTQGAWTLSVQYVVAGRVAFSQGLDYRSPNVRGA